MVLDILAGEETNAESIIQSDTHEWVSEVYQVSDSGVIELDCKVQLAEPSDLTSSYLVSIHASDTNESILWGYFPMIAEETKELCLGQHQISLYDASIADEISNCAGRVN